MTASTGADEARVFDLELLSRAKNWTPGQFELIRTITGALRAESWVKAAFLVGSLGRGTGDIHSDVDYHVLAEPIEDLPGRIRELLPGILIRKFGRAGEPGFPQGVFGLLDDGLKFDVFVHDPGEFDLATLNYHTPVFDRPGSRFSGDPELEPVAGYREVGRFFPAHAVEVFYLSLEGLPQLLCRGEHYLALRNCALRADASWVPLFLAENGIEKFDGKRRLAGYLDAEQNAVLVRLMDRPRDAAGLVRAVEWELTEFAGRARALAREAGAEWPQEFEGIVVRKFRTQTAGVAGAFAGRVPAGS